MKVLIFGRRGQLGSQLTRLFSQLPEYQVESVSSVQFDLAASGKIAAFVAQHAADWVLNAAAYTAVDQAESNPDQAYRLNALAAAEIAAACAAQGRGFVHYSTDYVFDGQSPHAYRESDPTNPQNVYGQTKLAGEQLVLQALPSAIVLRTAWLYAASGANFVTTMLRLAAQRTQLKVVDDQFGCPTYTADLAAATVNILRQIDRAECSHQGGIFHATAQGTTNWYQFCKQILQTCQLDHVDLQPIPSSAYPTAAKRPRNSALNTAKLKRVYGQTLPTWQDALTRCLSTRSATPPV